MISIVTSSFAVIFLASYPGSLPQAWNCVTFQPRSASHLPRVKGASRNSYTRGRQSGDRGSNTSFKGHYRDNSQRELTEYTSQLFSGSYGSQRLAGKMCLLRSYQLRRTTFPACDYRVCGVRGKNDCGGGSGQSNIIA